MHKIRRSLRKAHRMRNVEVWGSVLLCAACTSGSSAGNKLGCNKPPTHIHWQSDLLAEVGKLCGFTGADYCQHWLQN